MGFGPGAKLSRAGGVEVKGVVSTDNTRVPLNRASAHGAPPSPPHLLHSDRTHARTRTESPLRSPGLQEAGRLFLLRLVILEEGEARGPAGQGWGLATRGAVAQPFCSATLNDS